MRDANFIQDYGLLIQWQNIWLLTSLREFDSLAAHQYDYRDVTRILTPPPEGEWVGGSGYGPEIVINLGSAMNDSTTKPDRATRHAEFMELGRQIHEHFDIIDALMADILARAEKK